MDKDQLIENFFRSLRITFINALSYSQDHPYFIKSVESFKLELETLLAVLNPLKIVITGAGIVVDAKNLAKTSLYDELARLLHQRKIKSIEIKSGATTQEITQFLFIISRPQKDIFKSGGVNLLFTKAQLNHFAIEELDYSAFLQAKGVDCTDIWGYMLDDAVHNTQADKLVELADNFGTTIKQINGKDFFADIKLPENISDFLVCLKDKDKPRFDKCTKEIFLWLLNNKKTIDETKLAKLKFVFSGLSQEDLSDLFLNGLLHEEGFDSLSVQLFSKIAKTDDANKIAGSLLKKVSQSQYLQDNPKVVKKIRNILGASKNDALSAVYRNTLESLVKQVDFSGKRIFDHRKLRDNYRYIVLNVFLAEQDRSNLQLVVMTLEKELDSVIDDKDFVFIKDLWDALAKRGDQDIDLCSNLNKKLTSFIENLVLNNALPLDQELLIEKISVAAQDANFYLDKIFNVEKVNRQILNLFYRLFVDNLKIFYARLDQKIQDMDFLSSLIEAVSVPGCSFSMDILKYIYPGANQLIKVEVLKSMRKLDKVDRVFLMWALNTDSVLLKKNILAVLTLDKQGCGEALDFLLKIPSPWASKNKTIIENLQIVYELSVFEATKRIKELSLRRFFWNSRLRNQAIKILKEWHVS